MNAETAFAISWGLAFGGILGLLAVYAFNWLNYRKRDIIRDKIELYNSLPKSSEARKKILDSIDTDVRASLIKR